jgi:hypothetical protein
LSNRNDATKASELLMEAADFFASAVCTEADIRAWRALLTYCPAEALRDARVTSLRERRLAWALREVIYEATHLSPRGDDGSHWCRISCDVLTKAREAVG